MKFVIWKVSNDGSKYGGVMQPEIVEGELVELELSHGSMFFMYQEPLSLWCICELSSGALIAKGVNRKRAISQAIENMKTVDSQKFKQMIVSSIKMQYKNL